ncbi:hypothetical protein LLEC1_02071 [Akanthomyces lecanii]|uniref:Uncharacterized protein n=1 Tax=Cordyceps confragosa TaxID=2714763 RepID=A0A179IF67_CORDF|nr:hypothetical protein LLEC1_02071 [Akanthomyces lecanii]
MNRIHDLDVSYRLMASLSEVSHLRSLALNFLPIVWPSTEDSDASSGPIADSDASTASHATEETADGTNIGSNSSDIYDVIFTTTYQVIDGEGHHSQDAPEEIGPEGLPVTQPAARFPPVFKLESFRNLTRLSVMNMFGDPNIWTEWLLNILLQSPSLKHLSLSIAAETDDILDRPLEQEQLISVFGSLCIEYGTRDAQRLQLRTLRLGFPFSFPDLPTLSNLTEPKHLEDVYIFNPYGCQMLA